MLCPKYRLATKADAKEVYELMQHVSSKLEDAEQFVCDDYEFVKRHISSEGFIVLAYVDDKLVGSHIVRMPGDSEDNLGRDVGFDDGLLPQVVHMESSVVLEVFRGNNLQYYMILFAMQNIPKEFKYIFATASPNNLASCKNLNKCHMAVVMTKEKYDGKLRHIFFSEINVD